MTSSKCGELGDFGSRIASGWKRHFSRQLKDFHPFLTIYRTLRPIGSTPDGVERSKIVRNFSDCKGFEELVGAVKLVGERDSEPIPKSRPTPTLELLWGAATVAEGRDWSRGNFAGGEDLVEPPRERKGSVRWVPPAPLSAPVTELTAALTATPKRVSDRPGRWSGVEFREPFSGARRVRF